MGGLRIDNLTIIVVVIMIVVVVIIVDVSKCTGRYIPINHQPNAFELLPLTVQTLRSIECLPGFSLRLLVLPRVCGLHF